MDISRNLLCVLGSALAASVVSVHGEILPFSQVRSVAADSKAVVPQDLDQNSGLESALDFSFFNEEVAPLSLAIQGAQVSIAQGVGKQVSGIADFGIAGSGEASVSLTLLPGPGASAEASGQSLFDVVFTITKLSNFILSGSLDTQAIVTGGATIPALSNDFLFEDVDNSLTLFDSLTQDEAFSLSGVLAPGTYRLYAVAEVDATQAASLTTARTVSGISSFDFDFRIATVLIPEPGTLGTAAAVLGLCGLTVMGRRRRA